MSDEAIQAIEPALAAIARWDYSRPTDPLREFSTFLASAAARSQLPKIEARLLRMIEPREKITPDGRDFVCRQLSLIGTDASVPALARLLADPAAAESACYALARIPGAEAAAALRVALPKTPYPAKSSVINAVGERRDAKAVPVLQAQLASPRPAVADAAWNALARVGNADALAALKTALPKARGARRQAALDACIRLADILAAGGSRIAARSVYRQLIAPGEPPPIRIAALRGLASLDGMALAPALAKEIAGRDIDVQAAAIRILNGITGPEITASLVKLYPELGAMGKVRLLSALADRGDPAARPLAREAVRSDDPEIRQAALAALGKLGDASDAPLLAQAAADWQASQQAAARESLAMLRAPGVDSAIASGALSSTGNIQLEFIRATGDRAAQQSGAALMKIAQGGDPQAAAAAIRALRYVAGPEQAPALLDTVLKIGNASQRREAALTLASVMKRARTPEIGPVLEAYRAAGDKQMRLTLIEVFGQVSAAGALPVLRAEMKNQDQDVARAAILALTAWQTPEPLPDLLESARNESNAVRQILALRGFIKVTSVPSDRPADETVALLKQAWQLAKQAPEKRSILAVLPLCPTDEALRMAETAAADPAVAREAKAAADNIRGLGVR